MLAVIEALVSMDGAGGTTTHDVVRYLSKHESYEVKSISLFVAHGILTNLVSAGMASRRQKYHRVNVQKAVWSPTRKATAIACVMAAFENGVVTDDDIETLALWSEPEPAFHLTSLGEATARGEVPSCDKCGGIVGIAAPFAGATTLICGACRDASYEAIANAPF